MRKFFYVLLNIFKVLLVIYLIFVLGYLALAINNKEIDNTFKLEIGNFKSNPIWLANASNNSIDDIYEKLDEKGKLSTAYDIYTAACKQLMLTKDYAVRAACLVDVSAADMEINVISNRTEEFHVVGEPVLNANQKVESSYTNTIYVAKVSDQALSAILTAAVQFADRGYSDSTNSYKQKGELSKMDDNGENITWNTSTYEKLDTSGDRKYVDDDIREKCNFIISPTTIVPESVIIEREFKERYNQYLYHVNFKLDCVNQDEGGATYYESKAIKELLGKNMKSLIYSQMEVDMTMYSNGYFITWNTIQEWTLEYSLSILGTVSGTALNRKSEVFSYDKKECEVVNFTK